MKNEEVTKLKHELSKNKKELSAIKDQLADTLFKLYQGDADMKEIAKVLNIQNEQLNSI